MEKSQNPNFSCVGCGRTFRWKPDIAGKKAKCSCGTTIYIPATEQAAFSVNLLKGGDPKPAAPVPASPAVKMATRATKVAIPKSVVPVAPKLPPPPPPPEPVAAEDDFGEYDLADDAASLLPSAEALRAASAAVVAQSPVPVAALEYQRAPKAPRAGRAQQIDPSTGEFSDPMREYIVPLILLASGIGLLVVNIMQSTNNSVLAAVLSTVVVAVMLGVTLVKTGALVLASFPLATYCDVGLGLLRTAILKLAAVVLLTDTIFLIVEDYRRKAVGAAHYRYFDLQSLIIYVTLQIVIYHFSFWYLFRIPLGNVMFACLMAFAARLFNLVMAVVLVGIIAGIVGAAAVRAGNGNPQAVFTARNVPAISQPLPQVTLLPRAQNSASSTQPGALPTAPTSLDTLISDRIRRPQFHVQEGYDWARGSKNQTAGKLINDMYSAGAAKVYVDGFTCLVLLPSDAGKRAACLEVSQSFRKETGQGDTPFDMRNNYQYIVLPLF